MELTPEKLAFIQNVPAEKRRALPVTAKTSTTVASPAEDAADDSTEETVSILEQTAEARRVPNSPRKSRRSTSTNTSRDPSTAPNLDHFRVGVTVRIHPHVADALRRAHLEQKLRRQSPDTQQEIVEAALSDWLERNGFLSA